MTRQAFMLTLQGALGRLKPEERKEILDDFNEHFVNGLAGGKSEEEVARELGDPLALAAQYTEGLPALEPPIKASGVAQGVLAAIALILFDCIIALPVLAVLIAIWFSLWAVAASLLAAAFACMVAPFLGGLGIPGIMAGLGAFMLGIALLALTALAGIGMVCVTKWFFKGLVAYVKAHIRIIKGGSKA